MLLYTHAVWSLDLKGFFSADGWLSAGTMQTLPHSPLEWSWFYWISSPALLWAVHIACLCVFFSLMIGFYSRTMSVIAFFATVSYINRASLAQFGLDDTNAMLALYLMVGPSGDAFSVDRWLKRRRQNRDLASGAGQGGRGGKLALLPIVPSVGANVAIRLIQLNLCVEYFFAGMGKAQGEQWWNGNAVLMAVGNLEYQSFDLTWLIHYRWIATLLAHGTIFLELSYCVLVWPRLTRPLVVFGAVMMHLGIGAFLGMWTFGLAMAIANVAFVSPWVVRRLFDRNSMPAERAGSSSAPAAVAGRARLAPGSSGSSAAASAGKGRRTNGTTQAAALARR